MYVELEKWLSDVIFEDSLPLGDCRYSGNLFLNSQIYRHTENPKKGLEFILSHIEFPEHDQVRETERFQQFLANAEKCRRESVAAD